MSGGHQAGVPQHFQDHGLRGLLQVSTLGETAGTDAPPTRSGLLCDYAVIYRPVLISLAAQTQGLGTALKVLFSGRQIEALPASGVRRPAFQLSRQEIVSLFNAFGR